MTIISITTIVCTESIRDLSVIVDSALTFDAHVNNVISKAYSRIAISALNVHVSPKFPLVIRNRSRGTRR